MSDTGVRVLRGEAWAGLLQERLDAQPRDLGLWMEANTRILKSDSHSRVGLLELDSQTCYLKLYRAKSSLQTLAFRWGGSRALRAYDSAVRLLSAGVGVPEPRACLGAPGAMLLLTAGVPGGDLKALWQQGEAARPPGLMQAAALTLGRLHAAGYAHGDCKWSNLLWQPGHLLLADLEAVAAARPGSRRVLRDLARFTLNGEDLSLPREEFESFLGAYLDCTGQQRGPLVEGVLPLLRQLRERHRVRYGERGHHLL